MAARSNRTTLVFNVLKTVCWAVIAIALIKFAFFPTQSQDSNQALNPDAAYTQMTVLPETGDITNKITLESTVEPAAAVEAKATLDGEMTVALVDNGAVVNAGDPILEIRKEMPGEEVETTDEEGNTSTSQGDSWYKYAQVLAPAAGKVTINALTGQTFNIGDAVASVQPETYFASGSLSAEQMYRVQTTPKSATITIKDGPAPFACTDLQIILPKSAGGSDDKDNNNSSANGTNIVARCTIPAGQKVFPGLQASMEMVAGEATGVLTLPVSAVEGRFEKGFVYVPTDDPANPEKVEVVLGLSDGQRIEIKEGLDETREVLEFIPGQQSDEQEQLGY